MFTRKKWNLESIGRIYEAYWDVFSESILVDDQIFWDNAHFVYGRYPRIYISFDGLGPLVPASDFYEAEIDLLNRRMAKLTIGKEMRTANRMLGRYSSKLEDVRKQKASADRNEQLLFYSVKECYKSEEVFDGWDAWFIHNCAECNGVGHGQILASHWIDLDSVDMVLIETSS